MLVHDAAVSLARSTLRPADRVLVLGATGWFGRTAAALLEPAPMMLVASRARHFAVGQRRLAAVEWDWAAIRDFAPTMVVDCAFLTRDRLADLPLQEYIAENEALTARLLDAAALGTVEKVVTISSGAAVYPRDALDGTIEENPYGWLKRHAEQALKDVAFSRGIASAVARAWSVSGAFVQRPRNYAFADMILQAIDGHIAIAATRPVYRRYVSAEDLLAATLASAGPHAPTVESGGPLLEMGELAEAVAAVINPAATISRPAVSSEADRYYGPAEPWDDVCAEVGLEPADLTEQILTTRRGLEAAIA